MLFFFIAIPDKKWRKIPQLQLHQSTRVPPGWLHECVAHLQWRRFSGQEEAAVLQPGLPGELEAMSQLVTDDLPCYSLPKKTIYYCMYIYIMCIYGNVKWLCYRYFSFMFDYPIWQLVGWISKDTAPRLLLAWGAVYTVPHGILVAASAVTWKLRKTGIPSGWTSSIYWAVYIV